MGEELGEGTAGRTADATSEATAGDPDPSPFKRLGDLFRRSFGRGSGRRPTWAVLSIHAGAAGLAYVWALLCVATLDLFTWQGDIEHIPAAEPGHRALFFMINAGFVWLLILLVAALTNRLWLSFAIAAVVTGLAGFVNLKKIEVRHEPIYPSDLSFAHQGGFLVEMVGWRQIVYFVVAIAAVFLLVLGIGRLVSKPFPRLTRKESPSLWRNLLVVRLALALGLLLVVNSARSFNDEGNPVRGFYEAAGINWAWWSQDVNYRYNGFVAGYLYNLDVPPMDVPDGYSQATMQKIVGKYQRQAERYNSGRDHRLLPTMNIVLVLSEAFSDPYRDLKGVSIPQDPIPFTHRLMRRTTSSHMLAQYYGGGTANMEFELLTGLSLSRFQPQLNSPFQQLVPKFDTFPSVVPYLEQKGLDTLAIHPYDPTFYRRSEVYPRFGIDRFVSEGDMSHTDRIQNNDFISDRAAFDETLDQLRADKNPLFVNLVTMQNHVPTQGKYSNPLPIKGVSGESKDEAGGYLRGINYTDKALKGFIKGLKKLDEPTAVIFYGDHLPGIWPNSITDQNPDLGTLRTPFFMWTNFRHIDEALPPTVSPIYFLPTLFDQLDIPLPPYYVLLRKLQKQIPAMEIGVKVGPDGRLLDDGELSPRAQRLLHDYALVEYDLVAGKRYSLGGLFYPVQTLDRATSPRARTAPAPRTGP